MGLHVKEFTKERKLTPQGAHRAACVGVYDLGTHHNAHFDKDQQLVLISWEMVDESIEMDGDSRPPLISRRYTSSLNEKAQLRKDLEAWRGGKFTAEELKGFNLRTLLCQPCQIQVVHVERDGRTYANVTAIMSVPTGMDTIVPETEPVYFDMDEGTPLPEGTPEWIRNLIEASPEWKERYETPIETERTTAF